MLHEPVGRHRQARYALSVDADSIAREPIMPEGQAGQRTIAGGSSVRVISILLRQDIGNIGADTRIGIGLDAVGISPDIDAVAHLQTVSSVVCKIVVGQNVAGTLKNGHSVLIIPERTVGMNDIVRAVAIENDPRPGIVERGIADHQAVFDIARNSNPVTLLRAIDRIESDGGFSRAIM